MCTFKKGLESSDEDEESLGISDTEMSELSSVSESGEEAIINEDEPETSGEEVLNQNISSVVNNEAEGYRNGEEEPCDDDDDDDDDVDDNDDDELIRAIKAAKHKERKQPPEISFEDLIVDVSFHPNNNVIAAGSVLGDVFLYKYANENNELLRQLELHVRACRDVEFSEDGCTLYSCGKDKSIMLSDTETGQLKKFYDNAHEDPIYKLYVFDENRICSGDEEGTVKVWDIRREKPVMSFKSMEDFVSDMITTDAKKFLVCSSGDGTITSFNIPARKMFVQSEGYDAELNCLQLLKYETKLLTCSSKGKMYLYNWGEFGYHSDVYSGPKSSINSLLAITEHIIVAGFDDGNIRAVNLFPHRQLGVVGQHNFSIESLDISHDGEFIASSSLDHSIRFWNIRYFEDLYVVKKKANKKVEMAVNLPSSKVSNPSDFFGDLNK